MLDATTRDLLPTPVEKGNPNYIGEKARRDLGLRLPELFRRGLIPLRLEEISGCIKEDGNDATHAQEGIAQADTEDMQDFTILMLEERYTLPGQIEQNKQRRKERREPKAD